MKLRALSMLLGAALAVPVDPPDVPRYIAEQAVDSDANPGYTSHCDFLGVRGGTDVYSCTAGYPDDVTLRLEHDRGTQMYRATILTDRLDWPGANVELDETLWCVVRSELVCADALDRRLFPRAYGTLVPGNIGCHWIDYRVHRLDEPCGTRGMEWYNGPNGPGPRLP